MALCIEFGNHFVLISLKGIEKSRTYSDYKRFGFGLHIEIPETYMK